MNQLQATLWCKVTVTYGCSMFSSTDMKSKRIYLVVDIQSNSKCINLKLLTDCLPNEYEVRALQGGTSIFSIFLRF